MLSKNGPSFHQFSGTQFHIAVRIETVVVFQKCTCNCFIPISIYYKYIWGRSFNDVYRKRNLESYNTLMPELVNFFLDIKNKYFLNPFSTKLSPKNAVFNRFCGCHDAKLASFLPKNIFSTCVTLPLPNFFLALSFRFSWLVQSR